MKIRSQMSAILVFLLVLPIANSVAVVPPVVYAASITIAGFLGNLLLFVLALMAGHAIFLRKHFGRETYVIIRAVLSGIGHATILLFSVAVSFYVTNPIGLGGMLKFSGLAAAISLVIVIAIELRRMLVSSPAKAILKSVGFSVFVFIAAIISIQLATSTQVIVTETGEVSEANSQLLSTLQTASEKAGLADYARQEGKPALSKSQAAQYPDEPAHAEATVSGEHKEPHTRLLLFYPKAESDCIISVGDQQFSFEPSQRCYVEVGGNTQRIFCPIMVSSDAFEMGYHELVGSGSCKERYSVIVEDEGFILK